MKNKAIRNHFTTLAHPVYVSNEHYLEKQMNEKLRRKKDEL